MRVLFINNVGESFSCASNMPNYTRWHSKQKQGIKFNDKISQTIPLIITLWLNISKENQLTEKIFICHAHGEKAETAWKRHAFIFTCSRYFPIYAGFNHRNFILETYEINKITKACPITCNSCNCSYTLCSIVEFSAISVELYISMFSLILYLLDLTRVPYLFCRLFLFLKSIEKYLNLQKWTSLGGVIVRIHQIIAFWSFIWTICNWFPFFK